MFNDGEVGDELASNSHPCGKPVPKVDDRPVSAPKKAIRAKCLQHCFKIRPQRLGVALFGSRAGADAGEFPSHMGKISDFVDVFLP